MDYQIAQGISQISAFLPPFDKDRPLSLGSGLAMSRKEKPIMTLLQLAGKPAHRLVASVAGGVLTLKTPCVVLLGVGWLVASPLSRANLIVNGTFDVEVPTNGTGGGWTSGNNDGLGGWKSGFGNPAPSFRLNQAGQLATDPFVEQTVSGLSVGTIYLLSGDYALGFAWQPRQFIRSAAGWHPHSLDRTSGRLASICPVQHQLHRHGRHPHNPIRRRDQRLGP